MDRVHELCEGKVCILGGRDGVAAVMGAILSSCGGAPTIALCREGSPVSGCAGKDDRVILLGRSGARGELFPDLLDPFLSSPYCGLSPESIVEALSDVLMESYTPRDGNDAYWIGNAGRLFRGMLLACLEGMHYRADFSFANFVKNYRELSAALPAMTSHDPTKGASFRFPAEDWALPWTARGRNHPLEEPIINIIQNTAQITVNTFYSHTGRLSDMLKFLPEDCGYFNMGEELDSIGDGTLYLVLSRGMARFSSVILRFVLGALTELFAIRGESPLRVVIPDVGEWGGVSSLGKTMDAASADSFSLVWGASTLTGEGAGNREAQGRIVSLVARCDRRGWLRSGDPVAAGAYATLVPGSLRTYELTSIPPGLCFLQTPCGDFDGVSVPRAPKAVSLAERSVGEENSPKLWRDTAESPPEQSEDERPGSIEKELSFLLGESELDESREEDDDE